LKHQQETLSYSNINKKHCPIQTSTRNTVLFKPKFVFVCLTSDRIKRWKNNTHAMCAINWFAFILQNLWTWRWKNEKKSHNV